MRNLKKIIDLFGPRLAGTKSALDTADYLYDSVNDYADEASKEEFYIHQGAFFRMDKNLSCKLYLSHRFFMDGSSLCFCDFSWSKYSYFSATIFLVSTLIR